MVESCFSAGELNHITRTGLEFEYCSCNSKISECQFWTRVHDLWFEEMTVTWNEFKSLRHKFERNATFYRVFFNRIFPSREFKLYQKNTLLLFDCIHHVSGAKVIIDSSKSPQRIAVLGAKKELKVIHLCREFKGVLNSAKHSKRKNIEQGIEADAPQRRTSKTFFDWFLTNLLCEAFKLGINSKKIKYVDYIKNPELLVRIDMAFAKVSQKEVYTTPHMLAGNHLRMKNELKVDRNMGFSYNRLSRGQLRFAKIVDGLFWFWH